MALTSHQRAIIAEAKRNGGHITKAQAVALKVYSAYCQESSSTHLTFQTMNRFIVSTITSHGFKGGLELGCERTKLFVFI
jgi:hypothetical protein